MIDEDTPDEVDDPAAAARAEILAALDGSTLAAAEAADEGEDGGDEAA